MSLLPGSMCRPRHWAAPAAVASAPARAACRPVAARAHLLPGHGVPAAPPAPRACLLLCAASPAAPLRWEHWRQALPPILIPTHTCCEPHPLPCGRCRVLSPAPLSPRPSAATGHAAHATPARNPALRGRLRARASAASHAKCRSSCPPPPATSRCATLWWGRGHRQPLTPPAPLLHATHGLGGPRAGMPCPRPRRTPRAWHLRLRPDVLQ